MEDQLERNERAATGPRIFRVDGGKIVERWDPLPHLPEAANDNTMF